jgi:hypothetical protein
MATTLATIVPFASDNTGSAGHSAGGSRSGSEGAVSVNAAVERRRSSSMCAFLTGVTPAATGESEKAGAVTPNADSAGVSALRISCMCTPLTFAPRMLGSVHAAPGSPAV